MWTDRGDGARTLTVTVTVTLWPLLWCAQAVETFSILLFLCKWCKFFATQCCGTGWHGVYVGALQEVDEDKWRSFVFFFFWRLSVHIRHCCAASIVQSEWCIEARTHPQTRPRSNWMKQNKINTRFHWIAIWLKLIGLIRQREIDGIRQFCKLVNYSNILSRFEGNV